MIATVKIDKGFFDLTIPAAKEPKGIIFAKLETKINSVIQDIADDKLGDVATTVISDLFLSFSFLCRTTIFQVTLEK